MQSQLLRCNAVIPLSFSLAVFIVIILAHVYYAIEWLNDWAEISFNGEGIES